MIYEEILHKLEDENRLRKIPDGLNGLDLISNDYMSLGARHSEFIREYIKRYGYPPMSASASRLLQRHQDEHNSLESMLDGLYGKRILMLNSGYHANTGALSALSISDTLIISDKLIHASMIDGIRLGHGDTARFVHNDMNMLRKILDKKASQYKTVVIAVESVYSMDGDIAPLEELVKIKKEHPNVLLYVDEAHAFGVFGKKGLGLAEEVGVLAEVDIIIATLGKAVAGYGAFIATSDELHSYFINSARSFIFSTALPPSIVAWDKFMIERLIRMRDDRKYLRELSQWFRKELDAITGMECQSRSQIIPIHAGSASRAIEMASKLRDAGIDALPIRRPTVPAGTERLRLSLSVQLTREKLRKVLDVIKECQECF